MKAFKKIQELKGEDEVRPLRRPEYPEEVKALKKIQELKAKMRERDPFADRNIPKT